jgi:hypothetical protein
MYNIYVKKVLQQNKENMQGSLLGEGGIESLELIEY